MPAKTLILLALLLALSAPAQAQSPGGAFALENGDGMTVTDRDFQGRFLLVLFGDTNSPWQSPSALFNAARALAMLGVAPARLQAIFIAADPPDTVSRYATLFSPDIIGLSGSTSAINQAIVAYHADPSYAPCFYLMGPDGQFIATLPADAPADMLAARLSALMSQGG